MAKITDTPETAETIGAELERAIADLAAARTDAEGHAATYDDAVRAGDSEADEHERRSAVLARTIRRLELGIPEIEAKLEAAQTREETDRRAAQQAAAEKAAIAYIARLDREFHEPAALIAGLMRDWSVVEALLKEAGVRTLHQRLSVIQGVEHPERVEILKQWYDADGRKISGKNAFAGAFHVAISGELVATDAETQRHVLGQYCEEVEHVIPARRDPDHHQMDLPIAVRLPGYWGDAAFQNHHWSQSK